MTAPSVFRIADIQDRIDNLPENGTYIKPFVTTEISESMAGGINCLNKISVPWDLTCDEMIYCLQGTFRLVVDDIASGRLVRPFTPALRSPFSYWLVAPRGGLDRPSVASFVQWLRQNMPATPAAKSA